MANINGNEIYFGIIGEVGGGTNTIGSPTAAVNGTFDGVSGVPNYLDQED